MTSNGRQLTDLRSRVETLRDKIKYVETLYQRTKSERQTYYNDYGDYGPSDQQMEFYSEIRELWPDLYNLLK